MMTFAPVSSAAADAPLQAPCPWWGVLAPSGWGGGELAELDAVEAAVGAKVDLFGFYQGWVDEERFDRGRAEAVAARGAVPVLAWEPYDWLAGTPEQPEFSLARIVDGSHDHYIRGFARDVGAWGEPLLLRFAYEMNGDWFPWSESVNGNRPGEYVAAWRHVHDIFAAEGADNVSWVWAPNVLYRDAALGPLYPGDDYVDWLGVSGYNWGVGVADWSHWMPFQEVFGTTLAALRTVAPTKPILITETGSTEHGGDKAAWIRGLFAGLLEHPDVAGFTWFNYDKETDWRIQSSPAAAGAFAEGLAAHVTPCRPGGSTTAQRLTEDDPTAAAVAVSRSRFGRPGSAAHAVLGRDDAFADALAGSALSAEGPLLYTRTDRLPAATREELRRALPAGGRVYVLGGTKAISEQVRDRLAADGYRVRRLAGADRVETAATVAREVRRLYGGDRVVVARAFGERNDSQAWADSVAVGSWAARTRTPILLTRGEALDPRLTRWLQDHPTKRAYVLGGEAALADGIERALPDPVRLSGPTRVETSAAIATRLWGADTWDRRQFVVVNGFHDRGWALGLAAAGYGADRLAPILLVGDRTSLDAPQALLGQCPTLGTDLTLMGGTSVLSQELEQGLVQGGC